MCLHHMLRSLFEKYTCQCHTPQSVELMCLNNFWQVCSHTCCWCSGDLVLAHPVLGAVNCTLAQSTVDQVVLGLAFGERCFLVIAQI